MIILYVCGAIFAFGFFSTWFESNKAEREQKREREEIRRQAMVEYQALSEQVKRDGIASVLMKLHKKLHKARAFGHQCWLAACIENSDRLTPQIATIAVEKTWAEVGNGACDPFFEEAMVELQEMEEGE